MSRLYYILALVALAGCVRVTSLTVNISNLPTAVVMADGLKLPMGMLMVDKLIATKVPSLCPIFKLPYLPDSPSAPLAQLEAITHGDSQRLDELLLNYAETLKTDGLNVRRLIREAHEKYVQHCETSVE